MQEKLSGVFAPITTPFTSSGEVDYRGLEKNMAFYAESGLKGYLALGSNGENKSLTNDEKLRVLEAVVKNKAPGQVVMAGCIFESTFETIDMAHKMEALGPDFLTLLPPNYFKKQMTDDALCKYFTDVADAVGLPCLVYKAPQFAGGVDLSVSLLKRLAAHPNIVGIKDSSTGNIESVLFAVRDCVDVLAGSINNFLTGMFTGGSGGVLSLANSFPAITVELYDLIVSKQYEKAIMLNDRVLQINKIISGKGGVAAVKYAMDLNGLAGGEPRLPLLPLKAEDKYSIKVKLQAEGLI
ncbi:MAG: dihydrodipicolinate synthase family protein [Clostridia bacterium]|nr:dihydrodipicolinate synthase family protein [Clostridia bacterium]